MAKASSDEQTLKLIAEVKKKKEEIAKADRPNWRTHSSFSYVEGSSATTNIKVETDIKILINMAFFVCDKETSYDKTAKLLGVESPPQFKWCGFSKEDWIEDFKLRIAKIQ